MFIALVPGAYITTSRATIIIIFALIIVAFIIII